MLALLSTLNICHFSKILKISFHLFYIFKAYFSPIFLMVLFIWIYVLSSLMHYFK